MSLPKVTVCLGSSRPGGVDVSLAGLSQQEYAGQWEVVFCDWLYHRRHASVLDAVRASQLHAPFFHVPNARYSGDRWITTCNGYNTSVALADGEIVILLLDYALMPYNWISEHVAAHVSGGGSLDGGKRFVMAPHVYRDLPEVVTTSGTAPIVWPMDLSSDRSCTPDRMVKVREDYDDISVFRVPFGRTLGPILPPVQEWRDPKLGMLPGPADPGFFHTKNESFPREVWMRINGMDETFDRGRGPGDTEVARRLARAGYEPWVCPSARVDCLNPRSILPNPNGCVDDVSSIEGRMTYVDGARYCDRSDAEGRTWAPNPVSMVDLRDRIWHWRQLSQQREVAIEKRIVSDADYFGVARW